MPEVLKRSGCRPHSCAESESSTWQFFPRSKEVPNGWQGRAHPFAFAPAAVPGVPDGINQLRRRPAPTAIRVKQRTRGPGPQTPQLPAASQPATPPPPASDVDNDRRHRLPRGETRATGLILCKEKLCFLGVASPKGASKKVPGARKDKATGWLRLGFAGLCRMLSGSQFGFQQAGFWSLFGFFLESCE